MASKKSKVDLNEQRLDQAVTLFGVAAEKNRLKILQAISTEGKHVDALCKILGQKQPGVSHHLSLLRVSGFVASRREGKFNFYSLLPLGEKVIKALDDLTAA